MPLSQMFGQIKYVGLDQIQWYFICVYVITDQNEVAKLLILSPRCMQFK